MTDLTFEALATANRLRCPEFKNRKGELAYPDGIWTERLSSWSNACLGELGEAANIIKKIERGDATLDEFRQDLADELADVMSYLDIVAQRAGIDLGEATRKKFNEVSDRVSSTIYLD